MEFPVDIFKDMAEVADYRTVEAISCLCKELKYLGENLRGQFVKPHRDAPEKYWHGNNATYYTIKRYRYGKFAGGLVEGSAGSMCMYVPLGSATGSLEFRVVSGGVRHVCIISGTKTYIRAQGTSPAELFRVRGGVYLDQFNAALAVLNRSTDNQNAFERIVAIFA